MKNKSNLPFRIQVVQTIVAVAIMLAATAMTIGKANASEAPPYPYIEFGECVFVTAHSYGQEFEFFDMLIRDDETDAINYIANIGMGACGFFLPDDYDPYKVMAGVYFVAPKMYKLYNAIR